MTSFFEKLKKGMDIEKLPKEEPEQTLPSVPPEIALAKLGGEKEAVNKEPKIILASTKTIVTGGKKKERKRVKKEGQRTPKIVEGKKKEFRKIKVEGESIAPRIITGEKEIAEKKWFESEGQLTVDVYQTEEEVVIQSAIAGIQPEDLAISIENDMVIIRGNREKPFEKEKRNYFYQECYWGPFSREIILPEEVDSSKAKAGMKQGVLTIRIPKIEREKKKKIIVKG